MHADRRRLSDTIQSVSGFAFLVGLLLVGLPLAFPPESGTALATEVAAGLAAMTLGAWGAWQGRLDHPRLAFAPGLGIMVVAMGLALLTITEPLPAVHVAALAVLGIVLFVTGAVDATWAARAGRPGGFTRRA